VAGAAKPQVCIEKNKDAMDNSLLSINVCWHRFFEKVAGRHRLILSLSTTLPAFELRRAGLFGQLHEYCHGANGGVRAWTAEG